MADSRSPRPLDRKIRTLHRSLHRAAPNLDWLNLKQFRSLVGWVMVEGVELATLRASLFLNIDSRLRHGMLRRLALGMESHPPRTLRDALAFTCAALLELDWIVENRALSRFSVAECAQRLRPAFAKVRLPAWTPILPYCAGGYGEGPPPTLDEEAVP